MAPTEAEVCKRPDVSELCRILQVELGCCASEKDIDKLFRLAKKIISATASDTFCTSGGQAYRLREALRPLRESGVGAALGYGNRLVVQKVLSREIERRRMQLASDSSALDSPSCSSTTQAVDTAAAPRQRREEKFVPVAERSPSASPPISPRLKAREASTSGLKSTSGKPASRPATEPAAQEPTAQAHALPKEESTWNVATAMIFSSMERKKIRQGQDSGQVGALDTCNSEGASPKRDGSWEEHMAAAYMACIDRRGSVVDPPLDCTSTGPYSSEAAAGTETAGAHVQSASPAANMAGEASQSVPSWGRLKKRFKIGPLQGTVALKIWLTVFEKLKEDGEVHHSELRRALDLAGYLHPDEECIKRAKAKVTQYSTLSPVQFSEFIVHFSDDVSMMQGRLFEAFDRDKNGSIDRDELKQLLIHFQIRPMRHILDEVFEEVDEDNSGMLNLEEFRQVCDIMQLREGFTKAEFHTLMELFYQLDANNSGDIDARELGNLLTYLDMMVSPHEKAAIMQEVDNNKSGSLSIHEYLLCMRKCRHLEIQKLRIIYRDADENKDLSLDFSELLNAYKALGYAPDVVASWEAAQAVGISDRNMLMDFSDFWRMLMEYRLREGLQEHELQDIEEAFKHADVQSRGELSIVQIDQALQHLGQTINFDLLQYLMAKVDLDVSSTLSQREFRKFIRLFRHWESKMLTAVFDAYVPLGGGSFTSDEDAWRAFQDLGLMTDSGQCFDAVQAMGRNLNLDNFREAAHNLEKAMREFRKRNFGFNQQQIADLHARFQHHDVDSSGEIESKEMVNLIQEVLPGFVSSSENRAAVMQLMFQAAGIDEQEARLLEGKRRGHGRRASGAVCCALNFTQFLRFMSLLRGFKLDLQYKREQRTIQEGGLTLQEVQEFRELFLQRCSGDGFISVKDLEGLIRRVCPLGFRNMAQLEKHLEAVVGHGCVNIDFDAMLRLMRRLLDANFGGIRERIGVE